MLLTFRSKSFLGDNAWLFRFGTSDDLAWRPGQFVRIELPHTSSDALGTNRRFTIAGIPQDNRLSIATRITGSSFKRTLDALQPGDPATLLDLPSGDFVWQPHDLAHIYLAGGIGITPFYALLKDRLSNMLPANAQLFYASRPGATVVFETQLRNWARQDPSLKVTFQSHAFDLGELLLQVPDLRQRLVYASGPRPMISLCLPPINLPVSSLKQDNFPGYPSSDF